MKVKYSILKQQIERGYLPHNFTEKLRAGDYLTETDRNEIILESESITTRCGCIYHKTQDLYKSFVIDKLATRNSQIYILKQYSIEAYGRNGYMYVTYKHDCREYNGDFYHRDFFADNNLVTTYNGDLAHIDDVYLHSDGYYYYEEEADENENSIYSYDCGIREKDFRHEDNEGDENAKIFGFGIEIEKNELPSFNFNRAHLYDETGAVIERDSSVSSGFELKTPIYNLMSSKTDERIQALKDFCDIKNVQNAGGHIGFSCEGMNDNELLDAVRGFLPLIYAMHKNRLTNTYCRAKRVSRLKAEKYEKMQSIRLRNNYIEFRIFSSVKTFDTLLFRLELFRIIAQNLHAPFGKVIGMCIDKKHPLHNLLAERIYKDSAKFTRLITDAIEIDKNFGQGRIKAESIVKIQEKIIKIFNPKEATKTAETSEKTAENLLPFAPIENNSVI